MTIKQLGGVFGRNPTFNDVTIEGELTFDGDIDINSDLKIDGDLVVTGGMTVDSSTLVVDDNANRVGIGTTTPQDLLHITLPAGVNGDIIALGRAANSYQFHLGMTSSSMFYIADNSSDIKVGFPYLGGITFNGDTAAANALDDYEEGDWTPIYKTSGTNYDSIVYNFQFGTYIKIGQLVWVSFQLRTTSVTVGSASGNIRLGGLPFTVGSGNADDAFSPNAIHTNFASGSHGVSSPVNGTTESQLMDSSHSIASAATIATGANGNWLQGNIIYVAS